MREGSEGLPVERWPDTRAHESSAGSSNRSGTFAREGGWDPFEVWRTRVKAPSVKARQGEDRPAQAAGDMDSLR